MSFYVHESSYVDENVCIGDMTKIWHFCHIQKGASIGKRCSIGQNVNISNNVHIGNDVKIQNNVSVYEGTQIEDGVFLGPSCVFTNDLTPRARYPKGSQNYVKTIVCDGASIGANATIVCGHTIGRNAMIAAGAVVTKDVLGEPVQDIYEMQDGTKLTVPEVLRTKRPLLNNRQYYTTRYGKNIDVMSSTYPITQNGQLLGAFTVMEDWHMVDELHRQIIELQGKLLEKSVGQKKNNALPAKYSFKDICYTSTCMQKAVEQCRRVAKGDSSVMIYGETGTGKELFAQSIHNASRRRNEPFVAINCAVLSENLLESELFGYVEGAFTDARKGGKIGLFEAAHNGTLFLDEIAEISPRMQGLLLRVLQEHEIMRVGDDQIIPVNVRVIAATNRDLAQMSRAGLFRLDLYYRLNTLHLVLPPLRERGTDVVTLFKRFLTTIYNRNGIIWNGMTAQAEQCLLQQP